MTEFLFIRPWWLLAIPPGLASVWWLRRFYLRGGAWEAIVDPVLLPSLAAGTGGRQREWPWVFMAVAVFLVGVALAGPAFEASPQPVFRSLSARIIVLDVSRSMDARDLSPSRMVRARQKVFDLLRRSRDRRAGLVVFAGDAFVVAPLTRDADTLVHLLSAIDSSVVPVQGNRPDLGLVAADRLLERGRAIDGEVILVTDGPPGSKTRDAAAALAARDIPVSLLAVGTEAGAPVPLSEGGFLLDAAGAPVVARVDREALRAVAEAGNGRFATVTADDTDVDRLLDAGSGKRWFETLEQAEQSGSDRRDEGPWLVLLLVPMAALAFRRGWLLLLPLVVSVAVPDARALEIADPWTDRWADLWARPDQRAAIALEQGDFDRAVLIAPDYWWRGTALYRAGRFRESAEAFAVGDGGGDHYNRGNALLFAGDVHGALAAYREALARQPSHEDAAHNLDIVESMLASAPLGLNPPGGDDTSGNQGAGVPGRAFGADNSGEHDGERERAAQARAESTRGELARPGQASVGPRPANSGDGRGVGDGQGSPAGAVLVPDGFGTGSSYTDEQRAAYAQWLRRIPDDPGGLLRRKFALAYRSRGASRPAQHDLW